MKSPIKKLLVYFNQSNSCNLIYFYYKFFGRAKEENIYAIKSRRPRTQILSFLYFSSFAFKENQVFNKEDNPSQKPVIVEIELDDIYIHDIGDLEDLPGLVFIDKEFRNPEAVD